jgi:hypothetical protein
MDRFTLTHWLFAALALGASLPARAQQSLFNVPSGDITENGEDFFQEQVNGSEGILAQ